MSSSNFVKGACRRCGGHLEFPAYAVGATIQCPHCGQPTELAATFSANKNADFRRAGWGIAALVFVAVVAAAGFFFSKRNAPSAPVTAPQASVPTPAGSNLLVVSGASPNTFTNLPTEIVTNDFALLPFKLEKAAGSSLIYVTGTVRNLSDRQRFGVKITFGLFDTNDIPVGKATDYQSALDPNGDWHFKAMVMVAKAATARLDSIVEK